MARQPTRVSLINAYNKAKDREKRRDDALGLLESSKKKLEAKVRDKAERNCEEVTGGLCKLFDGLPSDALEFSLCVLDSKLRLLKERMEGMSLMKAGSCQRKELVYQFGDLHENSDIGLRVVDEEEEQASLDMSNYVIGGPYFSSILELENFNNPMVGGVVVGNCDDVTADCFHHPYAAGTNYNWMLDNNCDLSWLDDLIVDANNPFSQSNSMLGPQSCNTYHFGALNSGFASQPTATI